MSNLPSRNSSNILSGVSGLRVVVTAGASGIGLVIARLLHAQGCRLAMCDVSSAALDAAGAELLGIATHRADLSDETEVARFFDRAMESLGGLDALANNAGIAGPTGGVEEIAPADWRRCLDVGLTGQFLCTQLAVPLLKAADGGSIVNMSSAARRHG